MDNKATSQARANVNKAVLRDRRFAGATVAMLEELLADPTFPPNSSEDSLLSIGMTKGTYASHYDPARDYARGALRFYLGHLRLQGWGVDPESFAVSLKNSKGDKAAGATPVKEETAAAEGPKSEASSDRTTLDIRRDDPLSLGIGSFFSEEEGGETVLPELKRQVMDIAPKVHSKSGDPQPGHLWNLAMQLLKAAAQHVITSPTYGLATLAKSTTTTDSPSFADAVPDARLNAYETLDELFKYFPPLEIIIDGVESIITLASYNYFPLGDAPVDLEKLAELRELLSSAFLRAGGEDATPDPTSRQARKMWMEIARYRTTDAYLLQTKRERGGDVHSAKIRATQYGGLVKTAVEDPSVTVERIKSEFKSISDDVGRLVISPARGGKTSTRSSPSGGTAMALAATSGGTCDTCKAAKRPEKVWKSHPTSACRYAKGKDGASGR